MPKVQRPPLSRRFYARDPRIVARELLGKVLVRQRGRRVLAGRIVEVEAYLGEGDLAAHAAAGKTERNEVLFGPPGHAYVYFIYGNHYCLNVSCERAGKAGCVLIRALEPLEGLDRMAANRDLEPCAEWPAHPKLARALTSGPGRLCEALDITRAENGKDVTDARSDLFIANDGFRPRRVATTPRIGITRDAQHALRYVLAENQFVSGPRKSATQRTQRFHEGSP